MIARHEGRTAHDTAADDCAEGFLGELDEILWVLQDIQRAEDNHFRQAVRKTDHIADLRRLLYRLHLVLTGWEETSAADSGTGPGLLTDAASGREPGGAPQGETGAESGIETAGETAGEAGAEVRGGPAGGPTRGEAGETGDARTGDPAGGDSGHRAAGGAGTG